jgi:hypothetical protein
MPFTTRGCGVRHAKPLGIGNPRGAGQIVPLSSPNFFLHILACLGMRRHGARETPRRRREMTNDEWPMTECPDDRWTEGGAGWPAGATRAATRHERRGCTGGASKSADTAPRQRVSGASGCRRPRPPMTIGAARFRRGPRANAENTKRPAARAAGRFVGPNRIRGNPPGERRVYLPMPQARKPIFLSLARSVMLRPSKIKAGLGMPA